MTAEQFAYWLQGYAELNPDTPPTAEQWKMMQEHLATVFNKITPPLMPDYREIPNRIAAPRYDTRVTC